MSTKCVFDSRGKMRPAWECPDTRSPHNGSRQQTTRRLCTCTRAPSFPGSAQNTSLTNINSNKSRHSIMAPSSAPETQNQSLRYSCSRQSDPCSQFSPNRTQNQADSHQCCQNQELAIRQTI